MIIPWSSILGPAVGCTPVLRRLAITASAGAKLKAKSKLIITVGVDTLNTSVDHQPIKTADPVGGISIFAPQDSDQQVDHWFVVVSARGGATSYMTWLTQALLITLTYHRIVKCPAEYWYSRSDCRASLLGTLHLILVKTANSRQMRSPRNVP